MTFLCLFWINVLCINLQDSKKQSKEVAMMKDIDAGAEEVVVWLGEEKVVYSNHSAAPWTC
jgi:hypothetical protein